VKLLTPRRSSIVDSLIVILNETTTPLGEKFLRLRESCAKCNNLLEASLAQRAFTYDTLIDATGADKSAVFRFIHTGMKLEVMAPVHRVRNLNAKGTFIYAYSEVPEEDVVEAMRRHIAIRKVKRMTVK
jgi:hypothetical protein